MTRFLEYDNDYEGGVGSEAIAVGPIGGSQVSIEFQENNYRHPST